jgi:hypothetical protein
MESCARVHDLLADFADRDLGAAASDRVAGHLACCGSCRRRVDGHLRVLNALEALPQVVPSLELRTAVLRRIAADPLPVAGKHGCLRLVKAVMWAAPLGAAATGAAAGALVLARTTLGRSSLADPTLMTEWLIAVGQMAFSFLLSVATHAELPTLFSMSRGLAIGQETTGWLFAIGGTLLLTAFGIVATARAFLRSRSR